MSKLERMTVDILRGAQIAGESDLRIQTHVLAAKYETEERFVREKLVELHKNELIRLSAWDDSGRGIVPLEEWRNPDSFFDHPADARYKRVRLLLRGTEFLEKLSAIEDKSIEPKRSIGFHSSS